MIHKHLIIFYDCSCHVGYKFLAVLDRLDWNVYESIVPINVDFV